MSCTGAKEVCRFMANPTDLANASLKRMCRYLRGRPRMVWKYPYQRADKLEVYTDTDWAGCPRTRKSTSGGVLMFGGCVIKTWSTNRAVLALSSTQTELSGGVSHSMFSTISSSCNSTTLGLSSCELLGAVRTPALAAEPVLRRLLLLHGCSTTQRQQR